VSPEHFALAVDRQQPDLNSQLAFTRRLIGLRRASRALREGGLHFVDSPADLLVFERRFGAERLLCAFNLGMDQCSWRPDGVHDWHIIEWVGSAQGWTIPPLTGIIARWGS
jgi:alpha-glucosidase